MRPDVGSLKAKSCEEGENITWTCPVASDPLLTITWYKDDIPLQATKTLVSELQNKSVCG